MQVSEINLLELSPQEPQYLIDGAIDAFSTQYTDYLDKYQEKFSELKVVFNSHINASEDSVARLEYYQWLDIKYLQNLNVQQTKPAAAKIFSAGFKRAVVVGMGGSGINALVLKNALYDFRPVDQNTQSIELLIQNNLDSTSMASRLEYLAEDLDKTAFLIISKSGSTDEVRRNTHAIISAFINKFGKDEGLNKAAQSFVFITEPPRENKKNFLHGLRAELNSKTGVEIPSLDNHHFVGGRFSMFSPVGMLPAELMGLDSEKLLAGAQAALEKFLNVDTIAESQVGSLALLDLVMNHAGIVNRYSMVYSDSLEGLNKFRAQLKGESLNKNSIDSTVHIPGVGTVNHHSDLELLLKDQNALVLEQIYFAKPYAETNNHDIGLDSFIDLIGDNNHASLIRNHIAPLRTYLQERSAPVITTVIPEQDEFNLAYILFVDMLVTVVQAGLQDNIGQKDKLDLAIRQWEVEKYKASLKK